MPYSVLQLRILTALLLAPPFIAGVLLLPPLYLALLFGVVVLIAAWEWSALCGIGALSGRWIFVIAIAAAMVLLRLGMAEHWLPPVLALLVLWWLAVAVRLFRVRSIQGDQGVMPWRFASAVPVLLGAWLSLVHLHAASASGPVLLLFLLVLIWTADSAAYFSGKRWGRTKLAPALSPGKTWEGVYGALAGAGVAGLGLAWGLGLSLGAAVAAVLLCVLTAAVSVVGDLYESLIKRQRGVKDSGHLLPGHGGVLDRIDSLMAAAPVFTLGMHWLAGWP